MRFRILVVIAGLLSFAATAKPAQAATKSAHAALVNAQGTQIGIAKITATNITKSSKGVKISVKVYHLTEGEHGIQIHTVGKCDGPAFTTAGGHFNPTNAHHGAHNTQDPHPHLGDLMNLVVNKKGEGKGTFVAPDVSLDEGANSLFHEGGTSLVIHAKADDLKSDPSGNSGDRIACGVIEK
jgi:Cu-Zn family superoxide dismutase